jgi:hypothetical protein
MNIQDLIAKMDAIEKGVLSEATAPTTFTPTHFHKGNLGNKLPLMMTEPGVFWWQGGNQGGGDGMPGGSGLALWNGNGENRSGWNPASVDGVIENGKYIDFPEGVTWKTYKPAVTVNVPNDPNMGIKPAVKDNPALTKEMLAKLQAAVQALQAAMSAPTPKLKEHHLRIARGLMESFGYNVEEGFNDSATDLINARQANFNMNNGGELAIKQAERRAAAEAEKAAAAAAAQKLASGAAQTAATNLAPAAIQSAAPAVSKVAQQAGINAGEKAVAGAAKTGLLKGAGKLAGKLLPGVGLAFGAKDAYDRYQKGDYLGAGLAGLSGVASLVPGVGTAASLGLDAANLARDYKAGSAEAGAKATPLPPGGDPKVQAIQQKLIAKGAKNIDGTPLIADGKMGKNTQAAMKQYGVTAESLAEGIRSLQERLALIEAKGKIRDSLNSEYVWDTEGNVYTMEGEEITDPLTLTVIWESVSGKDTTVQLDEFLGALAKGAWNLGKGALKGAGELGGGIVRGAGQVAKGGKNASAAVAKTAAKAGGAKGAGLKAGAAMARNPIKTGLGAAALGAGLGYGLTGDGAETPATTTTGPSTTTTGPSTTTTDTPATTGPEQGGMGSGGDLKALIQAVKDAMMPLSDMAEGSPEIMKALTDARVVLDMAEKSGSEQLKVDANNSADAKVAASAAPAATPAGGPEGAGKPSQPNTTGLNAPKLTTGNGPTQIPSGDPAAEKRTPAEIKASKDLGNFMGESDNELARWLKIARG